MKVRAEAFEDVGEKDEKGYFDYCYQGTIFRFQDGNAGLIARQYSDERQEAHFLGRLEGEKRILFSDIPYENQLFRDAVSYLIDNTETRRIRLLLSDGYVPVDLARVGLTIKELP